MKLSPVISFSILVGFTASLLVLTVGYFLNPDFITTPSLYFYSIIAGVIISLTSYFVFKVYIKNQFKKIYASIDQVFDNTTEDSGNTTQEKIESWIAERSKEVKELKTTEAYRREFFGNLAHELKTPVFSVEGYILTLLEGGLEDENINRKFLEKAAKGVDRITKVIQDMDTITKIESGELKLNFKKVGLFDLVKTVISELEDIAETKKISVVMEKPNVIELFVSGDKLKLEQIFTNLIANSIYYGDQDGKTTITIKELRNKIEITVKDNGIGIQKNHLPRLFERFYRVEKSRDRNQGGSGIGLAIVKHIIEAHNQSITVESDLNKGTGFTFSLDKF
ncbi:MAG: ATP-binding protein [Flavobacteriales bacterium]|jgi:two-component system phosphate regulon sensor histidine kinase PhoR|tara:strand:+ start:2858 stop:3868 length:1011 start_codon:yes stop_codon:yes gene_type:complete